MLKENEKKLNVKDVKRIEVTDLRFSDTLIVEMDENTITISNSVTKENKVFTKEFEPILNRFMYWTNIIDLIKNNEASNNDESYLNQIVDTVDDLCKLGVLISRKNDLRGEQLDPPGNGWKTAMRFILETRTKRETVYAIPDEFYEALAQKSTISRQPSAFYERVDAPFLELPDPLLPSKTEISDSFTKIMLDRRTARRFSDHPISESELSKLLYYSWGMTANVENPLGDFFIRKTSPSGGSLHPIEVYPIILNVENIPVGCYHYSVRKHGLEELSLDNPVDWIIEACGDQEWVAEAGVIFLCTAFLPRTAWKYDYSRVSRAVISEIGYTGQSAFLTATWLKLGAFTTAALRDEIFEEMLGLDPKREPVFSVTGAGHLETNIQNHSRPRVEDTNGVEGT